MDLRDLLGEAKPRWGNDMSAFARWALVSREYRKYRESLLYICSHNDV